VTAATAGDAKDLRESKPAFLPTRTFAGFAIAVIAVVTLAFLSFQALQNRSAAVGSIARTEAVIDAVDGLLSSAKDLETGQRGYLLTGDEAFLEPYLTASSELPEQFERLQALTRFDPEQSKRRATLQRMIQQNQASLASGIEARRVGATAAAAASRDADRGKIAMDAIRALAAEMVQVERNTLAAQQKRWEDVAAVSFYTQLGGAGVLVFLIVAAAMLASRDHVERETQAWIRSGQVALADRLQSDMRLEALGHSVLEFLARFLDAQRGSLYLAESQGLRRIGTWAHDAATGLPGENSGLLGEALASPVAMHVRNVPAGYFDVASSLGRAPSRELLLASARADGVPVAVLELGFFRALQPRDLQFLAGVSELLGTAVRSSRDRSRLEALLEETQRQAEELQTQQEELRVTNEELEEQGRLLRHSQSQLEQQQRELEHSNSQLEEQSQQLEAQRDDLARAQQALEQRASELERASQYKTEFLANMSHELRTPLNSTLILAKLLADNAQGNLTSDQVRYAQTIGGAGNDLLALINDILDLSKIEAGKVEVKAETLELANLLDSMAKIFEPMARHKGLAFRVELDPGAPRELVTDRQRLGQVLKNLLSNALKFTSRGEVVLGVRAAQDGRIDFAVRDTGIGLPEHQQDIIFEAFRQADGSTHRRFGGTGLGLSISRDLARMLGGDISVTSRPNEGSLFTLSLPVVYAPPATPPGETRAPEAVAAVAPKAKANASEPRVAPPTVDDDRHALVGQRTLLLIEDDATFAQILRDLAREKGFQCIVAQTAADGLFAAAHYLPNAIVLDMKLPDLSGLGVLDQLKRDAATRHIPVHVVSASDYSRQAMELGAVGYALKPVRRDELEQALQRLEAKISQQLHRVLVVEDDERQRRSVTELLANGSTRIVGVSTAAQALEQLEAADFDCIVMDLNLPDSSGCDLLERMAGREGRALPPVIVYTGRDLSRDEELKLRRFSSSIILKDARSPERLLDEVTLFLHQVESDLPEERQRMLKAVRSRESALDGRRVLVVEDDVRNVFALSSVLEPRGAKVEIARNGREALDALQHRVDSARPQVDMILMDIMMPEMDGLTAMREIRKRPEWARIPILALTAKAMPDDHDECLAAGANDYIAKPLDVERLLSLVRVWMPK
jgi:CheY-like chemotaxis protein/CHASE3 domain sensor protein